MWKLIPVFYLLSILFFAFSFTFNGHGEEAAIWGLLWLFGSLILFLTASGLSFLKIGILIGTARTAKEFAEKEISKRWHPPKED